MKRSLLFVSLALALGSGTALAHGGPEREHDRGHHYGHQRHDDYRDYREHRRYGYDREPHYYRERVRVTRVEPIYEYVEVPRDHRRECWTEEVRTTHHADGSGAVAGGIIGGVIGNQVGRHGDRDLATVAGVIIGATVGNELERRHDGETYVERERRCSGGHHVREQRISGYRVSYHHRGRTHVEVMDHDPGSYLEIQVQARL